MQQYVVDLKDLARKISFEGCFDPGIVDFGENFRQVGALQWNLSAERAGEEIRVAGSLTTALEVSCSRCLEPARIEITRPFDLFFRQHEEELFDEDAEVALTEADMRTGFFSGTQLVVGDILSEQVLLALPMKALCKVDCQGLCPVCGANRNLKTCNCSDESFSPHMEKLLEIKRKLEERSS